MPRHLTKPRDRVSPAARSRGTLLEQWVDTAYALSRKPASLYSGCRKIIRPDRVKLTSLDDSLQLEHCGYTKNKMRQLERHYLHQESIDVAVQLWDKRRGQAKYGSVGFTCYNHFVKSEKKSSKRASVMGPCIQSVTLTWLSKDRVSIDAFYRTTEFYKKFPADLVFIRDRLLPHFDLDGMECSLICHFANITMHPMYFVTLISQLDDPIRRLKELKEVDEYFHNWIIKWTARYVCPEYHHGIEKFAQAMRVKDHADKQRISKSIISYLRKNHPGYRHTRFSHEEDDE